MVKIMGDLKKMVAEGTFREDLWYRLAVFPIELPPLRERLEDLSSMAAHFAARAASRLGIKACLPTVDDMRLILGYNWPGNVRELFEESCCNCGGPSSVRIVRLIGNKAGCHKGCD